MLDIHLILGGARSGKSSLAETIASASDLNVVYIATATADDDEMADRITKHQARRPDSWQLVEVKYDLAEALKEHDSAENFILIDCLTLWLSNCLCDKSVKEFLFAQAKLLTQLENSKAKVIIVSNEVGHGIVPMGQLSRDFVDYSGWLHQELAKLATKVDFVIAGLPLTMKQPEAAS